MNARLEAQGKHGIAARGGRRFSTLGPRPSTFSLLAALLLGGCSWFTDFKHQPKIDPWETPGDTIPFRGNPQGSIPITGAAAPGFLYDRAPTPAAHATMAGIPNPVPADSASVNRGRIQFQINCAVCHGALGRGDGVVLKYGIFAPPIGGAANPAAGYTDGFVYGIIRNGKATMPSYNRIEDADRWDIVNYLRALQGKVSIPADSSHCRPGETGACVPGPSMMGPTRPAPYYRGATAVTATTAPAPADTTRRPPTDTTRKPEQRP